MKKSQPTWPLRTIVEVDWTDSSSVGRWKSREEYLAYDPLMCRSVGYLLVKDKRKVTLLQSLAEHGDMADATVIPRACITRMRRLK